MCVCLGGQTAQQGHKCHTHQSMYNTTYVSGHDTHYRHVSHLPNPSKQVKCVLTLDLAGLRFFLIDLVHLFEQHLPLVRLCATATARTRSSTPCLCCSGALAAGCLLGCRCRLGRGGWDCSLLVSSLLLLWRTATTATTTTATLSPTTSSAWLLPSLIPTTSWPGLGCGVQIGSCSRTDTCHPSTVTAFNWASTTALSHACVVFLDLSSMWRR